MAKLSFLDYAFELQEELLTKGLRGGIPGGNIRVCGGIATGLAVNPLALCEGGEIPVEKFP